MPQSLAFLLVHVIFSTKGRRPVLMDYLRPDLYAYLATVARNARCDCYRAGGTVDHVHLAIRVSRTTNVGKLCEGLKSSSSKWLKTQSPALVKFAWQRGYGAFSVGPADLKALVQYIHAQEAHHKKHSFQGEFRAFLKKYGIECDERYLWS